MLATAGGEAPALGAYVGHVRAGALGERRAGRGVVVVVGLVVAWPRLGGGVPVVPPAALVPVEPRPTAPVSRDGCAGAGWREAPVERRPTAPVRGSGRAGAGRARGAAARRPTAPATASDEPRPARARRRAPARRRRAARPRRRRRRASARAAPRPRRRPRRAAAGADDRPRRARVRLRALARFRVDVAMRRQLATGPAQPCCALPARAFLRMSAICSSIQSPGSRDVTISLSPRARRARSSADIVSAA